MKGIIFTEQNFNLIIQGIKTQTRRIIKPQPDENLALAEEGNYDYCDVSYTNKFTKSDWIDDSCNFFRPRYKVGETVYLKEPYCLYIEKNFELKKSKGLVEVAYKYGNDLSIEEITGNKRAKWQNKLFMPEVVARYFIKITGVRAERLQDISEDDCVKEGTPYSQVEEYGGLREAYSAIIDSINGKGTWNSNPWMWVYDYELTNPF